MLAACGGGGGSSAVPNAGPSPASLISQNGNNITVSGYISAISSAGLNVVVGGPQGYGNVRIFTNSSTVITATIALNVRVIVVGTGSISAGITATSIAPESSTSPSPSPSASPTPPATTGTTTVPSPSPTGALIALPAAVGAWGGTIVAKNAGQMTVDSGKGFFHTYFNGSTSIFGGTLNVGQYVRITGTGSPSVGVTALSLSISGAAPTTASTSGTVVAATPYGFTVAVGGSNVPITLTSSTVVGGGPLTVGSNVSVTGLGATSTSINAIQVVVAIPTPPPSLATPTPGPISQTHILTEDYLGGRYGTHSIAWSQASPWLNYAQTNSTDANAIASAGIKTQLYVDPNRSTAGDYMSAGDESTYTHDCYGNRITFNYGSTVMNVMNIANPTYQNRFVQYVNNQRAVAHFDVLFEDDSGPLSEFNQAGFPHGLPCGYTDSAWLDAGRALNQTSPVPVIFNSLGLLNGHDVSLSMALLDSPNTIGANYEHCYTDGAQPKANGWAWKAMENSELQVAARGKLFVCQGRNMNDASSQTDARLYALASFLLSYNPQNSVLWEEFATSSGLHVMPESQLVLTNPRVTTPSTIDGLLTTAGVYAREYSNCYIGGHFVSSCAVVVNPDNTGSHTFPLPQYQHTLVLSGSGVLDGGTMSTNGPPPPLTMGPMTAAIVFP
jgi:hypothetical protein